MNYNFLQQPQPQQYQMNQNQFNQQNYLQDQINYNQQIHMNSLKQPLSKILQLQNQPEFQQLIQLMITQQKMAKQELEKAMSVANIKALEPQQMDDIFKRSLKIRQKNSLLLKKLLLVKAKLQRLMYHDVNPHSRHEYETSTAIDKIRTLKSEITQKCAHLKTLKVNKPEDNGERRTQARSSNFSNIGTALTELKNGAQVLQREVLRQKTEMEFVVKYINDQV